MYVCAFFSDSHTKKTSHHVCDLPKAFVTLSMEKSALTSYCFQKKGQKRGLETRALNTIFTPCLRRTNCWLSLFYHSFYHFDDKMIEKSYSHWHRQWIWNNHHGAISKIKIPFDELCICYLQLYFAIHEMLHQCEIFFWKTNFNLEAILPCNKPTPW